MHVMLGYRVDVDPGPHGSALDGPFRVTENGFVSRVFAHLTYHRQDGSLDSKQCLDAVRGV